MELSILPKRLFAIKKQEKIPQDDIQNITNEDSKITYQEYGFQQAGHLGGTIPGLHVCLHKIYHDFRQEIKDDFARQEELKKPMRIKIEEYKGDNERLSNKIEKIKTETIPALKKIINNFKDELSNIRKNPEGITGDDAGKAGFIIGGVILLFLTAYLFVFYSSASYSTFFKEFTLNEIGVANSIFDANALSKAFYDGITELILILTIPFVFLGLGYLIHKFGEEKNIAKYFKIALLMLITFIFDSILAYEITDKIYNIKKENSFDVIPDYTLSMAFQSINFWLIIFAGFVVYVIWGFVFSFVMDAYAKMDKVKIALQEKEKQIKDTEAEIKDFELQIDKMIHTKGQNSIEINKLNRIIEGSIIPKEFEHHVFSFSTGWMAWMKQSVKTTIELDDANKEIQEFVKMTLSINLETIS
jgi:hypothetical protein